MSFPKKANYVLWINGLEYYVSRRLEPRSELNGREQFVEFFETQDAAYEEAIRRTNARIKRLLDYLKVYRASLSRRGE